MSYKRKAIFKPSDILPYTGKKIKMIFAGESVNMKSDRYEVFKKMGHKCVSCGIEGTIMALETHSPSEKTLKRYKKANKTIDNACVAYHFNLYGLDEDGNEVMLTKDHIIPKSRGGKNNIDNYQPMCSNCNNEKGNKL